MPETIYGCLSTDYGETRDRSLLRSVTGDQAMSFRAAVSRARPWSRIQWSRVPATESDRTSSQGRLMLQRGTGVAGYLVQPVLLGAPGPVCDEGRVAPIRQAPSANIR